MKINSDKLKEKAKAKAEKAVRKAARKMKRRGIAVAAIAMTLALLLWQGCQQIPSRSQTLNIRDTTINVYGTARSSTNEVAQVEVGTQTMAIENSGTETLTPAMDVSPNLDVRYNDALAAATSASKGVLESLIDSSMKRVLSLMADGGTGTVEVTKKDGTQATVKCENGQCSLCTDGSCSE